MLRVISRVIRRFRRDERGVVLMIFMLLVVPLLMVIAVAIDFGQTLVVKRQLTSAIDAAALTIGTLPDMVDADELNQKAEAYIRAHYPESGIGTLTSFSAVREGDNGEEVVVSASATVPTSFMGLAGIDMLTVNVNSRVLRRDTKLEIVMVLDNSGSMSWGNKIGAMRDAANTLVDTLFGADEVSEKVKIGLVPFEAGVNLNVPYDTWWLDFGNPSSLNTQNITNLDTTSPANETLFTVLGTMGTGTVSENIAARWGGCVRSRYNAGVDNLDISDAPPNSANPETLFSAYFYPYDGADKASYVNDTGSGQNLSCAASPIQPLTNQKTAITSAINAMVARTSTNITEGLAWGWRLISPGQPFTQGVAYDQVDTIKAIIVLSDGENAPGTFSSYGMWDNPQLASTGLDSRMEALCTSIKANHDADDTDQDVIIYTIGFDLPSDSIRTLMRNCATDANKFFDSPTAAALQSTFAAIAASLNQLRIMN